jgi:hypothetical protein
VSTVVPPRMPKAATSQPVAPFQSARSVIAELGPGALKPPTERRLRLGSQLICAALAIALAHTLRDLPRATMRT